MHHFIRQTRLMLFLLVILGVNGFVLYQWTGSYSSAPRMIVSESVLDLGTLKIGEERRGAFELRNDGFDFATIARIRTGCGCTRAQTDKTQLANGETARVVVQLRGTPPFGDSNRIVAITFDSKEIDPVLVQLRYSVQPSSMTLDPAYVDFGYVERKSLPVDKTVSLYVPGLSSRDSSRVTVDVLDSDSVEIRDVAPDEGYYRIVIRLLPSAPTGTSMTRLQIKDRVSGDTANVTFTARILGRHAASPPQVLMNLGTDGDDKVVNIRSRSSGALVKVAADPWISENLCGWISAETVGQMDGTVDIAIRRKGKGATADREFGRSVTGCVRVTLAGTTDTPVEVISIPIELVGPNL